MTMNRFSLTRRCFIGAATGIGLSSILAAIAEPTSQHSPGTAKLAICFGSGALHGFAHLGAIRALEQHGVKPDLICGTSVGAIVGVLWAAGHDADAIERIAGDRNHFSLGLPRIPILGLGRLDGLRQLIDRHTGHRRIESLPTRFAAIATDLDTGQAVILASGPSGQAVAASASIPLRYEPITIGDRRLVDGALSSPVPVDAARALGATFVLAIDVAYRPYEEPVKGFSDVAFQMFHIMVNRLVEEQIGRADMAIRLDLHEIMRDEQGTRQLIMAGERAVHERWPELQQALSRTGHWPMR